ncbi:MAG: ATP-binding protein [Bacteroidales bacterium]|nr:ATP-binding protein [Bacteroidales bacterium]
MIKRDAEPVLRSLAGQFKAVAVVGPRQSGKTTLTRHVFHDKSYVNLENPDDRRFALEDPRGFFSKYSKGAVIDEAQRAPELFSYLQQILDEDKTRGKFILTGSNNFLLQESISQSLAGRIAYLYLLPFTIGELHPMKSDDVLSQLLRGFYPPVYDQPVDRDKWYVNYIKTYIERDVRQLKNIANLNLFERFLRLCAGRAGQLLNMSSLALDCGVDNKTVGSWLGILESSFIIFRLRPYHRNFNKRIVKMPKLYFYDTGLACSLLGIHNTKQLEFHPLFGNLFENLVVSELVKQNFNHAGNNNLFFWRDNTGHEIDVIIETTDEMVPIEIKSGKTINDDYFNGLLFWFKISKAKRGAVIYSGESGQKRSNGIEVVPWNRVKSIL